MGFDSWSDELLEQCKVMGHTRGKTPPLLDALVAYRIGWTPRATARAVLGLDRKLRAKLVDECRKAGAIPPRHT